MYGCAPIEGRRQSRRSYHDVEFVRRNRRRLWGWLRDWAVFIVALWFIIGAVNNSLDQGDRDILFGFFVSILLGMLFVALARGLSWFIQEMCITHRLRQRHPKIYENFCDRWAPDVLLFIASKKLAIWLIHAVKAKLRAKGTTQTK